MAQLGSCRMEGWSHDGTGRRSLVYGGEVDIVPKQCHGTGARARPNVAYRPRVEPSKSDTELEPKIYPRLPAYLGF